MWHYNSDNTHIRTHQRSAIMSSEKVKAGGCRWARQQALVNTQHNTTQHTNTIKHKSIITKIHFPSSYFSSPDTHWPAEHLSIVWCHKNITQDNKGSYMKPSGPHMAVPVWNIPAYFYLPYSTINLSNLLLKFTNGLTPSEPWRVFLFIMAILYSFRN